MDWNIKYHLKLTNNNNMKGSQTANGTFAIGVGSCSAGSLVVAKSFVYRTNISAKKTAHRKSANRYLQCYDEIANFKLTARDKQ